MGTSGLSSSTTGAAAIRRVYRANCPRSSVQDFVGSVLSPIPVIWRIQDVSAPPHPQRRIGEGVRFVFVAFGSLRRLILYLPRCDHPRVGCTYSNNDAMAPVTVSRGRRRTAGGLAVK